MFFHPSTALYIGGLLYLLMPLTVWVALKGMRSPTVQMWCSGSVIFGVGMLMIGLRPWVPEWTGYTLANLAATTGMMLFVHAMRHELGLPLHPKTTVAGLVLFNLIFHFSHSLTGSGLVRYLFGQAEAILLIFWVSFSAYQVSRKHESLSAMWIAVVYLAFDVPNLIRWLQVALGTSVPSTREFDLVNLMILLFLTLTAVIGNIGFLGMFSERANRQALKLTDKQARQEEASNLFAQIAQLDRRRSIGELASSLSHELSQPMSNIHLIAETLEFENQQSASPDTKQQLFLQKILDNSNMAIGILQRIRDFIQNKDVDSPRERLNLNLLLTKSIALMEDSFIKEKVRLTVSPSDQAVFVAGNAVQLLQIIINILRNAKQATRGQSHRRVHLEVLTTGQQAMIRCQDNGPGFNAESLQKAGQAFFTTKLDGLGLGLSISKAIAEQHQGQLGFDNAPEGGAVVTLHLPVQR